MALKKTSKPTTFGAAEGLFLDEKDTQQVQQEQHVKVQEVQKDIGTTQGRKGYKLKRINMAFSDMNHEYITKESRRRGISSTAFVNQIIDEYRSK